MHCLIDKFCGYTLITLSLLYSGIGSAQSSPPNIVFIMLDDLGYGEMQWYPEEADISSRSATPGDAIKTPTLLQLAKEGVRFTNYHTPSPVCSPARVGILTGRYPQEYNFRDYLPLTTGQGLPAGTPTIASLLRDYGGYATAHFGKWHIGTAYARYLPVNLGFDESWTRFGEDLYAGYMGSNFVRNDDIAGISVLAPQTHSAETITQMALDYIESADPNTPYFLNVWYRAPHNPLDPPGNFPGTTNDGFNPVTYSTWPQTWAQLVAGIPELAPLANLQNHSPKSAAKQRAMFIATMAWVDYQIGRLVKRIDELDPSGNTLIVVTSDNGSVVRTYASGNGATPGTWLPNGQLQGHKREVREGALLVPLIVRWPAGGLTEGSRIEDLTLGYDFVPSLLDVAGIGMSGDNFVGVSFHDRLLNEGPLPARSELIVWENKIYNASWNGTDIYSTLDDEQNRYAILDESVNRKLVIDRGLTSSTVVPELYDTQVTTVHGINELLEHNRAALEPATLAALEQDYRDWRMRVGTIPYEIDTPASTAQIDLACMDFAAPSEVVQLEENESLWFRQNDFAFQTRLNVTALSAQTDAVVAEHPGSWTLKVRRGSAPSTLLAKLDLHVKDATDSTYPGAAGSTVTLSGETACQLPCDINAAFTVLGVADNESSVRLYLNEAAVAEYKGNAKDSIAFREIYANESAPVLLGNSSTGQTGFAGKIIDPRFYRLYLTPAEVVTIAQEQSAEVCDSGGGCH